MTCDTNIFTKNGLKRQNISTFEIALKEEGDLYVFTGPYLHRPFMQSLCYLGSYVPCR